VCAEYSSAEAWEMKRNDTSTLSSTTASALTTVASNSSTTASNLTTTHKTTATTNSTQTVTTANVTTSTPGNFTTAVPGNATTGTFEPTTGDHALCYTRTCCCNSNRIFREGRSPQTSGIIFLNVFRISA